MDVASEGKGMLTLVDTFYNPIIKKVINMFVNVK